MDETIAQQITQLINSQNQLTTPYNKDKVLEQYDQYIVHLDGVIQILGSGSKLQVLGVVRIEKVQWYQCEIKHLSVLPQVQGRGIAKGLLQAAEARAAQLGAKMVQCTIREDNTKSEGLFKKFHYVPTIAFRNDRSGKRITVFQKVLAPVPREEPVANPIVVPVPCSLSPTGQVVFEVPLPSVEDVEEGNDEEMVEDNSEGE